MRIFSVIAPLNIFCAVFFSVILDAAEPCELTQEIKIGTFMSAPVAYGKKVYLFSEHDHALIIIDDTKKKIVNFEGEVDVDNNDRLIPVSTALKHDETNTNIDYLFLNDGIFLLVDKKNKAVVKIYGGRHNFSPREFTKNEKFSGYDIQLEMQEKTLKAVVSYNRELIGETIISSSANTKNNPPMTRNRFPFVDVGDKRYIYFMREGLLKISKNNSADSFSIHE